MKLWYFIGMARFSDKRVPYPTQDELWKEFCAVLADMQNTDEVFRFMKDLLNRQERLMLARRLQVAYLLDTGLTYEEIAAALKMGKPTIARVRRWLEFGRGGYKVAIRRLQKKYHAIRPHFEKYYR